MADSGADWRGVLVEGIEAGSGEDAGEVAGVCAEVEDFGEVAIDILILVLVRAQDECVKIIDNQFG